MRAPIVSYDRRLQLSDCSPTNDESSVYARIVNYDEKFQHYCQICIMLSCDCVYHCCCCIVNVTVVVETVVVVTVVVVTIVVVTVVVGTIVADVVVVVMMVCGNENYLKRSWCIVLSECERVRCGGFTSHLKSRTNCQLKHEQNIPGLEGNVT